MNFDSPTQEENLLPYDGIVNYRQSVIGANEADLYFKLLLENIKWQHDEVIIYGKHIITKRKSAWYADSGLAYSYSGITKEPLLWTEELLELKSQVEKISGDQFNSCLLNLYHNGEEGMSWHSDDEKALCTNSAIASISFGATRKFAFKHKTTKTKVEIILESGSLLVMKGSTQAHWQHCLPKTKKVKSPRINLTFRTIIR